MRLETVHCAPSDAEKCPTCGGHIHKRVFGEMHAGSFLLDGKRVDIRKQPNPEYRDPIYLDEITQYFNGGLYRLWPNDRYVSRGGKRLHRDVWAGAFGPIPKGCHIHHRDGNTINNRLENLECIPASQHLSETWREKKGHLPPGAFFTHEAREKAADWHRSEEGRLWHKRHAQRSQSWTKWKREERPCAKCGNAFQALIRKSGNAGKYCSASCKVAAYRERGIPNEWARNYRQRKASERNG